jgi:peptidoglycan hydrolase-like protein with peptidoglycan-binding domain
MAKAKTITKKAAPSKKKQRTKKIIITSLAVGATGIIGYFGWQYFKKKKGNNNNDIEAMIQNMDQPIVTQPVMPVVTKPKVKKQTSTYTPPAVAERNDDFPLTKGSKGENVRKLQEALITKYGATTLPKYGADGDFGSEMVAALKKLGLPASITQSTYNVIAQGTIVNPATIGKDLYNAASSKDYNKAIALLKKMKSVDDYTSANNVFKELRINGGVRQTIVNGLLNVFTTETQKQNIKFEFLRMGLQYDGSKWSLSGFDGLPIVTMLPTSVWVNATSSVKVPARMVLGNEVSRRLDYTLFENGGKHFLVQTKNVKYL